MSFTFVHARDAIARSRFVEDSSTTLQEEPLNTPQEPFFTMPETQQTQPFNDPHGPQEKCGRTDESQTASALSLRTCSGSKVTISRPSDTYMTSRSDAGTARLATSAGDPSHYALPAAKERQDVRRLCRKDLNFTKIHIVRFSPCGSGKSARSSCSHLRLLWTVSSIEGFRPLLSVCVCPVSSFKIAP